MSKTTFDHKYNMKDKVYHVANGSEPGYVTDIRYSILTSLPTYFVCFSLEHMRYFDEIELLEEPIIT